MDHNGSTGGGDRAYGTNTNYGGHMHQGDNYGPVHHHNDKPDQIAQCLTDLPTIDPRSHKSGIERASRAPIKEVEGWILDTEHFRQWQHGEDSSLLWIEGNLATNETMLLCAIINELSRRSPPTVVDEPNDSLILAYFFCRPSPRTNNATAVLRGLLYLLVEQCPELLSHLEKRYSVLKKQLYKGSMAWHSLCDVLADMLDALHPRKVCFAVDHLDDCTQELSRLLDLMTGNTALSTLRWIISSRPNVTIRSRLERRPLMTKLDLRVGENAQHVSRAVDAFIDYTLPNIPCLADDDALFTRVREDLRGRSGGVFLWVSYVMKKLKEAESCDVDKVLAQVMSYRRWLEQVERLEEGKEADYCSDILSSVVAAYRPLSLRELGILSGLPWDLANDDKFVTKLVHMCGPLLDIREGIVHLIHQSARDFLVEEQNWWAETRDLDQLDGESGTWKLTSRPPRHINVKFAERSIEVISRELRRNMFNLPAPGASIKDYSPLSLASLGDTEYYMLHWADHLSDAWDDDRDRRLRPRYRHDWTTLQLHYDQDPTPWVKSHTVTPFLNQLFLYWLETLCATGNLSVGVAATAKLSRVFPWPDRFADADEDADVKRLVVDANRLLRSFSPCIGNYPSQLYYAGLVFAPSTSSMRQQFSKERPPWITTNPAVEVNWNVPPQIIEGHDGPVLFNTSFSRIHGIATISEGGIVRLWDRDSGRLLHTLNTRTQNVLAADFFEYTLLVASSDGTVQVWDARSGRLLRSIQATPNSVSYAAFSPSWPRVLQSGWYCWLALGCYDGAVRVYKCDGKIGDVSSVILHRTFGAGGGSVRSLAISSRHLVSVSSNYSIRMWEVKEGDQKHTITGHTGCRFSETCSPLSVAVTDEHIAAGLSDGTVRLWHIGSGESWHTLQGHEGPVLSVNFSEAGQRLTSGSADKTVRLWNCTLGTLLHTFVGHSGSVLSARVLSADGRLTLLSASQDGTVRIWDTAFNPSPMTSDDLSRSSTNSTMKLEGTQTATMCDTDLAGPIGQLSITGGLADASNTVGIGESCKSKGWDFSSDGCWIMWKENKVLWVPPEYRPVAFSREPNGLTFRCSSGRTLTIGFSTDAGKYIEQQQ